MRIYIVRHGETDWNSSGRWQGITDIPLNAKGIAQSKRIAEKLAGLSAARIYTSPLVRARETAEIIQERLGSEIVVLEAAHEIIMGEWTGLTLREMEKKYPEYAEWNAGGAAAEAGERYGVESFMDLRKRSVGAFNKILETETEDFLIVAHGTWIRALLCGLLHVPLEKRHCFEINNAGITILEHDEPSGAFKALQGGALA